MKIRTVSTTKVALLCAALVAALLMFANKASAVSIRDPSHYSDGSTYVRHLLGMGPRHDELSNGQDFPSAISVRHVVLPHHMNADRSVQVITTPIIGGKPNPIGGRVPDGGITAMLLGTALGVLGIARRYIRN
jgi:protein with PEP-CTERM/exosortase system signal